LDWNFSGFFLSKRAAEKGGMGDRALPIRTSEPSTRNSKCSKYDTRETAIFDKKFVFSRKMAVERVCDGRSHLFHLIRNVIKITLEKQQFSTRNLFSFRCKLLQI
jgi:hypothetical protein